MKKIIGNVIFYTLAAGLVVILLGQFGFLPLRLMYIRTGSMAPAYQPGDLAVLYTGKSINVQPGDVILFKLNGEDIIHRAIAVENGQITTQGDANQTPDEQKIEQVLGKALFRIPKLGMYFASFQDAVFALFR